MMTTDRDEGDVYEESAEEKLRSREQLVTLLAAEAGRAQSPYHYAMVVVALASAAYERACEPRVRARYGTIGDLAKALLSAAAEVHTSAEALEAAAAAADDG